MTEIYYRQCVLKRGTKQQVSWIPERFARKGHHVKLRKREGSGCVRGYTEWVDGWKVVKVGARLSGSGIHEREHLHHRKRTDI